MQNLPDHSAPQCFTLCCIPLHNIVLHYHYLTLHCIALNLLQPKVSDHPRNQLQFDKSPLASLNLSLMPKVSFSNVDQVDDCDHSLLSTITVIHLGVILPAYPDINFMSESDSNSLCSSSFFQE